MPALLPWLAALGPFLLLLFGLVPAGWADRRPVAMRRAVLAAAVVAALGAALSALGLMLHGQAVAGVLTLLDAVSATMLVLVAFIGLIVVAYSQRYLDGEPGQGRFMAWLGLTLGAVLVLAQAGNLLLLAAAFIVTSLGLHRLLVFYPERPAAVLAARKKFILARLAEAAVLAAAALAWGQFGTLDIAEISAAARGMEGVPFAVHAMALLVVLAALLKSAQLPTHGWLTEVMETPTPVSALLHAGIINAGGFLVVRLSDVVALSAASLDLLLVVGAATAVFGAAVMLVQTSVKVQLAWSTVAQMGFMVMQCGLGAFAAAMLHILAHSLYKAHAFLSAGGVAAGRRAEPPPPLPMSLLLPALALALLLVVVAGLAFGFEKPGAFVLGAVLVMGVAPMLAAGVAARRTPWVALRALGLGALVAFAWFGLQAGAHWLFGAAVPATTAARGPLEAMMAALVVAAFAALLVLNVARRASHVGPKLQALYVHLLNGFYLNALANRWLARGGKA